MIKDDNCSGGLASEDDQVRLACRELLQLIEHGEIAAAQRRWGPFNEALLSQMATEEAGIMAALEPVPELGAAVAQLKGRHDEMRSALARAVSVADDNMWSAIITRLLDDVALHQADRAAEIVLPSRVSAERFPLSSPDRPAERPGTFPLAASARK